MTNVKNQKETAIQNEQQLKINLINQFELLKRSSDKAYANGDYNSLTQLSKAMIEIYRTLNR